MINKKLFINFWVACIAASLAILPYTYYVGMLPFVNGKLIFFSIIQSGVFWGVILWLSYLILRRVDIEPLSLKKPLLKQTILPGIIAGVLVGLCLILLERFIFLTSELAHKTSPVWAGFLASFYGGFNEEILCRLFLLTFFYFILRKVVKDRKTLLLSIATVLTALLFSMGHLPALYHIIPSPSAFEVTRVMVLNSIAGLVFGWLYCTRGFWAGVTAHFVTDLVIHVIF